MNTEVPGKGQKPDVSVVIPTRDRVGMLQRCLCSVLEQSGVTFEVIVVDDGSVDGTSNFVDRLGDCRVRLVRHDVSQGVAAARNRGLDRARATWVAFIDDDDVWAPDKLAAQLEAAQANGAGWVSVGSVSVDENLRVRAVTTPLIDVDLLQLLSYNFIPGGASGTMIQSDLARSVGGFDTSLSNMADWDMWIRLSMEAPLVMVGRPLVGRFEHQAGMSGNPVGVRAEFNHIAGKYRDVRVQRGVTIRPAALNWCARRQVESGRRWAGVRLYAYVACKYGDVGSLSRALVALTHPGFLRRRWEHHAHSTVSSPWAEEAEAWLAYLRRAGQKEQAMG